MLASKDKGDFVHYDITTFNMKEMLVWKSFKHGIMVNLTIEVK